MAAIDNIIDVLEQQSSDEALRTTITHLQAGNLGLAFKALDEHIAELQSICQDIEDELPITKD